MIFPKSPIIELYNASSNDLLQFWKIKGKIQKEFEPYSKSYYHILLTGGVSILSLPNQDKQSLQMQNLFLLFQFVLINNKNFLIELNVRDHNNSKKMLKITLDNNYPLNIWTNLLIDTFNIFQQAYPNSQLKYIDSILITGNIKLRKIYALKTKEEDLPKSLDLGKSNFLQNFFLYNVNKGLEKIDIKFSEHSHKKNNNNIFYNTPLKQGKNSYHKTDNKTNINPLTEKTKKNLEFFNKIPKIERLTNEIKYGLKINQDGNFEPTNINKILGFKALENINSDINKKERERSLGKGSLQKEITNTSKRNKNKSLNYKIRDNKKNENIQKKISEKNIIENKEKDKNNSKIVFQNDTLYNFGNNKIKNEEPQFLSYGVSLPYENKEKSENDINKNKNVTLLQKMNKGDINYPIMKESKEKSSLDNNISNNNKYGNFEIMLDSALINNSKLQTQLYDSIEEESCLVNNINSTINGLKLDEKIIKLDPEYNKGNDSKNIINNHLENSDFKDFSDLINEENKCEKRPYTAPISHLVPINQSEIMETKDKSKDNNNPNNISYAKILKEGNELIFDEIKGCYFNPKKNIYYDIKDII